MSENQTLLVVHGITNRFFATRPTLQEGFDYAYELIQSLPREHRAAAFTALHVLCNTIADQLTKE